MNVRVTNVPKGVCRITKTHELQHLQFLDVGVSSGPPSRACVVRHKTDELLVEQHTVHGGYSTPVKEGAKHTQNLSRLSSYLVDLRQPGQPCNKGDPKVQCCLTTFLDRVP
jgi:hypothetical protein